MRIVTWNVNGLRAAARKELFTHLGTLRPDALLLQEVRALPEQLPPEIANSTEWQMSWHPAEKKGYSGTAIWSRQPHSDVLRGFEPAPDTEGRVVSAMVQGVQLVSVYLPSGSSSPERQAIKDDFLLRFLPFAAKLAQAPHPVILGGDLNIAPTPDDIWDPVSNKDSSGFLPHERAWFTQLLGTGLSDLVRDAVGPGKGPYSWWSNRGQARVKDRGWRIDFLLANAAAKARVRDVLTHRDGGLDTSDHAPLLVELSPS